jgi:DNA-binding LytR/AlgR family response regulator
MIKCIIVDDEPIAREILEFHLEKIPEITLVKSCKNVSQALKVISSTNIDLILLDINMPEISGLTLAKVIDKKIKIIFTTAYREYALDGFDLQAVDYLLKPISFERFEQGITKFLDSVNKIAEKTSSVQPFTQNFIFVRSERKMVKVNFDSILYIESLSDYIKIHTTTGSLITRETISKVETTLPTSKFLRIHRSFIIAINFIESYTNEFIEIGKQDLPISRTYKESVLQRLKNDNS